MALTRKVFQRVRNLDERLEATRGRIVHEVGNNTAQMVNRMELLNARLKEGADRQVALNDQVRDMEARLLSFLEDHTRRMDFISQALKQTQEQLAVIAAATEAPAFHPITLQHRPAPEGRDSGP